MEVLEQQLLELLKRKSNMDLKGLKRELNLNEIESYELLEKVLNNLEVKGLVYLEKNGNYSLLDNKTRIIQGMVKFNNDGDAIVNGLNHDKVIIPKEKANGLIDRDIITVTNLLIDKKGKIYGTLDKIIRRSKEQISCEVVFEDGQNKLIPYNSKSKSYISVDQKELNKHGVGEILLIRLSLKDNPYGHVLKTIGHKDEPDIDEKSIGYDHGFSSEFSLKIQKELEKIPSIVDVNKALKEKRRDLRSKNIFTIDAADTKDIDDAVGIEVLPNGNYKLYVSIADVAYYIKDGSALCNEAFERGTSVYMNDTVIPMLPPKISNGICSLHPNVNRLTKTCEMIIDKDGNVIDYDIYKSVINSNKKMAKEDVNKFLIDNEHVPGYEAFEEDLTIMNELSKKLSKIKDKRGYVSFSKEEITAKGKDKDIVFEKRVQKDAEELIENFMLLANETVAKHVFFMGLPFIYRVHEAPDEEKINDFINELELLGYKFKSCKSINSNKYIQNIVTQIYKDEENKEILSELLLASTMKRAKYSNINLKHFGLALKYYTHFTSPIRRYADLQVHKLLDLYENFYEMDYNDLDKYLSEVAYQCSERSKEADKAEIEAKEMRMAQYMENNIGKEFFGRVTFVGNAILKVKTTDGINGTVNINDITDDNYYIDNKNNKYIGRTTGNAFQIGSPINLIVKSASKKNRTVNFYANNNLIKDKPKTYEKTKKGK